MIYTAIFQSKDGTLFRAEYLGEMNRKSAWANASKMGTSDDSTLLVLIPGNHPAHTYESLFSDSEDKPSPTAIKSEHTFEMT